MISTAKDDGTILLLGGTSDIGGEVAVRICAGRHVVLAGRNPGALGGVEKRMREAGAASVRTVEFDAADLASHLSLIHI